MILEWLEQGFGVYYATMLVQAMGTRLLIIPTPIMGFDVLGSHDVAGGTTSVK